MRLERCAKEIHSRERRRQQGVLLPNGRVIAQTRDHSVCQAAVELGQLTPEQIRGSEDRVKLLKVLGNFDRLELKRQPEQISAMNGDAFLICTDGFWEHVHEREMECDLVKSDSPQSGATEC